VSTNLSFSPARFGYPSTIYGTIHVTPDAEPVDVLDRAIFQLYRDARVDSYQVMTERDGMLWDTENLGLSRSEDYSGLVDRYGQVTPGQSFPTPPPPRSAPTSRPVPDSTPISAEQTAVDAAAAIAAVRAIPGVVSTELAYSREKFGYSSSIHGAIHVTSQADPVDVLDRALFQLYRDVRVGGYDVMTERDGLLWDPESLGLSATPSRSALVGRYGNLAPGQTFPTPPPPRPAPTSRPVPANSRSTATSSATP